MMNEEHDSKHDAGVCDLDTHSHRSWQLDAFRKVERCNANGSHNTIPVNACVGSGKTNVASYAIGDFIKKNFSKKTIQMFVTPRIRLCEQQAGEIRDFILAEFGFIAGKDYEIIRKDCTQHDIDIKSKTFPAKHAVIVVCDESLWGVDTDGIERRWNAWMKFFRCREDEGYVFGNCVFDEAHNFTKSSSKIFGEEA